MSIDGQYTLETPENVEVDFELAGPGSRFCALLIDTLLWGVLLVVVVLLLVLLNFSFSDLFRRDFSAAGSKFGSWLTWFNALMVLVLFGIYFGYYVFFEWLLRGQTPGKRVLKIRVIHEDGTPARGMDIVVRNLVRLIDALPAAYALGGTVMFFHPMNKRLGDLAAGTIVVKERELDYRANQDKGYRVTATTAAVANSELEPDERRILSGFLQRRIELLPEARAQLAQRLAQPLFQKYGGAYETAESYIERLIEGKHHERGALNSSGRQDAMVSEPPGSSHESGPVHS